jgi:hypothetical protein
MHHFRTETVPGGVPLSQRLILPQEQRKTAKEQREPGCSWFAEPSAAQDFRRESDVVADNSL